MLAHAMLGHQKTCISIKIVFSRQPTTDMMNTKTPIDSFSFRRILARNVTLPLVIGVVTALSLIHI